MSRIEEHTTSRLVRRDKDGETFQLFCHHCAAEKPNEEGSWMQLHPSTPTKFFLRHLKTAHGLEVEE